MTEVPTASVSCSADCTDDNHEENFWQEKGVHILLIYVLPVIVFVGIIGNLITLAVLFSKQFRKTPSSLILGTLALVDTGNLCLGARLWLSALGSALGKGSVASCKAVPYFLYFLTQTSSTVLVILTVERTISVYFPLKCKEICGKPRILICVMAAIVFLMLANLIIVFALGSSGDTNCVVKPEYAYFIYNVWPWIDSLVLVFFPFILILIGNILIVTKLHVSRKRFSIGQAAEKRTSSVTVMLMAVSAGFLVLNLPTCIYFFGYYALEAWPTETLKDTRNQLFFHNFMTICSYTNYAINFIMYCLTGSKFREAVKYLFEGYVCKLCTKSSKSIRSTSNINKVVINSVETTYNAATTSVARNDRDITKTGTCISSPQS